jgi:hypothetical protein
MDGGKSVSHFFHSQGPAFVRECGDRRLSVIVRMNGTHAADMKKTGRENNLSRGLGRKRWAVFLVCVLSLFSVSSAAWADVVVTSDGTGIVVTDSVYGGGDVSILSQVKIPFNGFRQISAGLDHSVALKPDGTVWVWGDNTYGQYGDGTDTNANEPVQADIEDLVVAVDAGDDFTLAVTSLGQVWSWGYNNDGQLGDGTEDEAYTPVQVAELGRRGKPQFGAEAGRHGLGMG